MLHQLHNENIASNYIHTSTGTRTYMYVHVLHHVCDRMFLFEFQKYPTYFVMLITLPHAEQPKGAALAVKNIHWPHYVRQGRVPSPCSIAFSRRERAHWRSHCGALFIAMPAGILLCFALAAATTTTTKTISHYTKCVC